MAQRRERTSKMKPTPERAYHHGDLQTSLIQAGEVVLRRDGVAGLGMRAVTREAGVSHTAAKPHFGSLDGLRAEIAAKGYDKLADALESTASIRVTRQRRLAIAHAYVHFAHANTALFELMFRHELVDMRHPALVAATARAMRALAGPLADEPQTDQLSRDGAIRSAAGWAFVHGLAVLVVEKRLQAVVKRTPAFSELLELADAVVDCVTLKIET
jgi:AcrR family transcriptional regulator